MPDPTRPPAPDAGSPGEPPLKRLRTYHEVAEPDGSGLVAQIAAQRERVTARLVGVRHVAAVMSGKGGVGKSFVSAGLATALARSGRQVGVLDADLHAPTAARMLGASTPPLEVRDDAVVPARTPSGVRLMSSELLLPEGAPLRWRDPGRDRFVWRGALEAGMLREFLSDVDWGELDLLLVDLPPGTDRLEVLVGLVPRLAGVVVVTIPSEASFRAVERAVGAARDTRVSVLGVVENMAGYRCGRCGSPGPLFAGDAGERLARLTGSSVLGRIEFDPRLQAAVDAGALGPAADALEGVAQALLARLASS